MQTYTKLSTTTTWVKAIAQNATEFACLSIKIAQRRAYGFLQYLETGLNFK